MAGKKIGVLDEKSDDALKGDDVVDKPTSPPPEPSKAPLSWYGALTKGDHKALAAAVETNLNEIISRHKMTDYQTLVLFDERDSIMNYHSDRLYAAASSQRDDKKNILLILHSNGGSIEPAYLVSKTLKRLSKEKFVCAVPRRAKSAATLLALGSDEIHMGMISQLGPIDPQVGGLPALSIGNALEIVADLASRFPKSSDMLTRYLTSQISIRSLGFYQRISESAEQYAERLLTSRELGSGKSPSEVAKYLVNHYKDHGFVIDFEEAQSLLGSNIVKLGTPEYNLADEVYKFLDLVRLLLGARDQYCWFVGGVDKDNFSVRKLDTDQ